MNLENYPRTKELIQQVHLEDKVDRIKWLQLDNEEAAVALAKTYLISLISQNPFLSNKANRLTDQIYFSIGYKLHGFAKEEGDAQLGLSNEDNIKLFKHIAFGGSRFK